MHRRNRIDIIVDILVAASRGSSRTRIMYEANLNFTRFDRYFRELENRGLIEIVNSPETRERSVYRITEKAKALLGELEKVEHYVGLSTKTKNRFHPSW